MSNNMEVIGYLYTIK